LFSPIESLLSRREENKKDQNAVAFLKDFTLASFPMKDHRLKGGNPPLKACFQEVGKTKKTKMRQHF